MLAAFGFLGLGIAARMGLADGDGRHQPIGGVAQAEVDFGSLLIGDVRYHTVVIPIPSTHQPEMLEDVSSSCGCARLDSYQTQHVGDAVLVSAVLRTQPGPYERRHIHESVSLTFDDGTAVRQSIRAEVVPPFAGWTNAARAYVSGNDVVIDYNEKYAGRVLGAKCYLSDTESLPLTVDDENLRIVLHDACSTVMDEPLELVIEFEGAHELESVVWVGGVEIQED